jgi:hypothetical protein
MFRIRPDTRCQRGLRFSCTFDRVPIGLVEALRAAFSGQLVEGVERLGSTEMHRLILQFRFELRVDLRRGAIDIQHRASATKAQIASDRALFEEVFHRVTEATA